MKLKKILNIQTVTDKLTKKDLTNNISEKTGFSKSFSKKIIEDLINILISHIIKGNLNLKNVGSFKLINKKERMGRNPKTKDEFLISSRKSISFKVSKKITDNLNKSL